MNTEMFPSFFHRLIPEDENHSCFRYLGYVKQFFNI